MKRFLLSFILAFFGISLFGQSLTDVFDFFDGFNWNMSESQCKTRYAERIIPKDSPEIIESNMDDASFGISGCSFAGEERPVLYINDNGNVTLMVLIYVPFDADPTAENQLSNFKKTIQQRYGKASLWQENVPVPANDHYEGGLGSVGVWPNKHYALMSFETMGEDGLRFVLSAVHAEKPDTDFRKSSWGDSMAECKRKEGKADESGMPGLYGFKTSLAGNECLAAYRFTNDKLTSGKYIFLDLNEDICMNVFNQIKTLLTKKYGEPKDVQEENIASDWAKKSYSQGQLVRQGELRFDVFWDTPYTRVYLILYGERYDVEMCIEYYSVLLDNMREESVLEDL